jgi:hypothetical protein
MKPSVLHKADRIAKARAPEPRMHFFWWDLRETRAMVRARIRATIASGEASRYDRFVICTWTREEGDGAGDPPGGEQAGDPPASIGSSTT